MMNQPRRLRLYFTIRRLESVLDETTLDLLFPMYPAVQELKPVYKTLNALKGWIASMQSLSNMDRRRFEKVDFRRRV